MTAAGDGPNGRLIKQVVQEVRKSLGSAKSTRAFQFVRQLFANVPPDDFRGENPQNLAGAALGLWQALQVRRRNQAKIKVYNPTKEADGWTSSHTVIEIINDDMPFLVDSVTSEVNRQEAEVHLVVHPIIPVRRDGRGRLQSLATDAKASGVQSESVMHIQITEQSEEGCAAIAEGLERVLSDVRASVEDWRKMRRRCRDLINELEEVPPDLPESEIEEGLRFLKWLDDNHFTFLGYREYRFEGKGAGAVCKIDPQSGLGVLRDSGIRVFDSLRNLGKLPPDVRAFVHAPRLLTIAKGNYKATVHRAVHMDTIAVKSFDKQGRVTGERLFIGLFTSLAYSRSPKDIPLLREKVSEVMSRSGFSKGSHDAKALEHILHSYPRDELFQISVEDLFEISMGVLHLQERQRTALFARVDSYERFVSCMVYVPRDRYDTRLRLRLQDILTEAFDGTVTAHYTHVTDAALARLHVIIRTNKERVPPVDFKEIEDQLAEASRSWSDFLEESLTDALGEEQGLQVLRRYERAFSVNYQDSFDGSDAVYDIACIEQAIERNDLSMNLYRRADAGPGQLHFKIYVVGQPIPLSDLLPMLENMGLKVIGEVPFEVEPAGLGKTVWLHDFDMQAVDAADLDLAAMRDDFHDVFARVWHGVMENDGFNKLVLRAGLNAREIIVLRAYAKYLRQARIPFSQAYMEETLGTNPQIARLLVDLFAARFDPANRKGGLKKSQAISTAIVERLEAVTNLDEDRIIRRYLNVIDRTLRTNFYQNGEEGLEKPYVSFKLDSRGIDELPEPRPFREIFVYSSRIEGVHLRFGMVARGGLRWSDRREDFRTEILGLVKAQQVKNAVIVPVGSKGGFVVKHPPPPPAGREAFLAEGIECYKTFIRGLLDITDNIKGGKIVPPQDVVRHDQDDAYLVVAADKGTATFSDIANSVSIEYGHWLDDAFASGGSAGYDHKKMGITARGAWECVKRHFRERGKDIQTEDFTCVGVGDMSGDVFGNGMQLSKHIRLLGAFNHLHIFVDPDPDPTAGWKERKRLFDRPGTAWTDYDAKLISKGGGVFDRKAKSVKISLEMKERFEIDRDSMTPNELIRAMLQADTELLWFGGIGTYIKASDETDLDVGDRANDGVRITSRQVRAKVIGEGANLGVTHRARIEYGLFGGRCNSDSIDNSAGVDCSDHEVNIKILLGAVEESGKMSRRQRDKLLETMTDEVAEQCLRDNYLQSQSITVTHQLGAHLLDRFARYMRSLEKAGRLDRALEFLPDDEMVLDRLKQGIGLTRPEISVLLSYSKIVLYDQLMESALSDDPYFATDLAEYFPTPLRQKFAKQIAKHQLRREIVSTVLTNDLVNRVGINFVYEVNEKTGMPPEEITKAYIMTRQIFGMREIWAGIEALDNKVPAELQSAMLVECGRLLERETVWVMRELGIPLAIEKTIGGYQTGVAAITADLEQLLSEADLSYFRQKMQDYKDLGVPAELARRVAGLRALAPALDIVRTANETKRPVIQVARTYFSIGQRFGFDWLRSAAGHLATDTAWDKLAVTAIVDDLYGHQSELTLRLVKSADGKGPETVIDDWAEVRRPMVSRTEQLISELKTAGSPDFAMLAVANRQLKSMVSG